MTSIAIIGTGIAGLGCGYLLHRDFDIALFDRNGYAGGHSNTLLIDEAGQQVPIDTGFMVFNEITYPNLTRLFHELQVRTRPTSMSFGVQHLASGIEYCGSSWNQLFAQRRNLFRPRFLAALSDIDRFNREARTALGETIWERSTLGDYCAAHRYGDDFLELYLLPMVSAVWSTPFDRVRNFPAMTLLRFFSNHGLLGGLGGHHTWQTVEGGASSYVAKMTRSFRDRIALEQRVVRVERDARGVLLHFEDDGPRRFDKVIFACHADEALALLAVPTNDERRLLEPFSYQENTTLLHTDPTPMPRARRAWASWNYRYDSASPTPTATTIYWMNSLQRIASAREYFVSLNDPGLVRPSRVLQRIVYHHPIFDMKALDTQRELPALNQQQAQTSFFCGSYFGHGFHEDAFTSAIEACRAITRANLWEFAA